MKLGKPVSMAINTQSSCIAAITIMSASMHTDCVSNGYVSLYIKLNQLRLD